MYIEPAILRQFGSLIQCTLYMHVQHAQSSHTHAPPPPPCNYVQSCIIYSNTHAPPPPPPQDLVKELVHSKQRLQSTERELVEVKSYLDNLLLRIMESNPAILSSQ